MTLAGDTGAKAFNDPQTLGKGVCVWVGGAAAHHRASLGPSGTGHVGVEGWGAGKGGLLHGLAS